MVFVGLLWWYIATYATALATGHSRYYHGNTGGLLLLFQARWQTRRHLGGGRHTLGAAAVMRTAHISVLHTSMLSAGCG